MPLRYENGKKVVLSGELSDQDFDWKIMQWLWPSFSSPQFPNADKERFELENFVSKNFKGPYYIHDSFVNTRTVIDIVIMDPEDRKAFAKHFLSRHWCEESNAQRENLKILAMQVREDFVYENDTMRNLIHVIRDALMQNVVIDEKFVGDTVIALLATADVPTPGIASKLPAAQL